MPFWRVRFYPYDTTPDAPYVFAVSNNEHVSVCRIDETKISYLATFDDQPDEQWGKYKCCALSWAFIDPNEPLILTAGSSSSIQVFDVTKGCLKTTLLGHGAGMVNDIAVHPKYPWIVASASQDLNIRIWDLRRWDSQNESKTVVMCGLGSGHSETLLSIAWHDNGRYIVSGAMDNRVCVWTIPDLSPESSFWATISPSQRRRTFNEVHVVHYPHFVSHALHTNCVDSVSFYGDCILSKSLFEHRIVLWRITGFNSQDTPPDPILAPKAEEHLDSRNGFVRSLHVDDQGIHKLGIQDIYKDEPSFTRLLEFAHRDSDTFYMNFELIMPSEAYPHLHPILTVGTMKREVFYWDLYGLEIGRKLPSGPKGAKKKFPKKNTLSRTSHDPSPSVSLNSSVPRDPTTTNESPAPNQDNPLEKLEPYGPARLPSDHGGPGYPFKLSDPGILRPTAIQTLPVPTPVSKATTVRGFGWSPDGKYCVWGGEYYDIKYETVGGTKKRAGKQVLMGFVSVHGRWLGGKEGNESDGE
jgi:polycomb protein EED